MALLRGAAAGAPAQYFSRVSGNLLQCIHSPRKLGAPNSPEAVLVFAFGS
jgi:hypothetical protein